MIESVRLRIRDSTFEDCTHFVRWENQPETVRFLSIGKGRTYEAVLREFFQREVDPSYKQFTLVDKHSQTLIGRVHLSRLDNHYKSVDITRIYIGEPDYLQKGYGRELMQLLMAYCFETLAMERVTLDFYPGNKAEGLYRSLGFVSEGVTRRSAMKDGQYYDLHMMSMLKEEYYTGKQEE